MMGIIFRIMYALETRILWNSGKKKKNTSFAVLLRIQDEEVASIGSPSSYAV